VPPIAAEAPKATWSGAEDLLVLEDVAGQSASSLVPIPSSATLVPSSP
jgi:hypothetical protein